MFATWLVPPGPNSPRPPGDENEGPTSGGWVSNTLEFDVGFKQALVVFCLISLEAPMWCWRFLRCFCNMLGFWKAVFQKWGVGGCLKKTTVLIKQTKQKTNHWKQVKTNMGPWCVWERNKSPGVEISKLPDPKSSYKVLGVFWSGSGFFRVRICCSKSKTHFNDRADSFVPAQRSLCISSVLGWKSFWNLFLTWPKKNPSPQKKKKILAFSDFQDHSLCS